MPAVLQRPRRRKVPLFPSAAPFPAPRRCWRWPPSDHRPRSRTSTRCACGSRPSPPRSRIAPAASYPPHQAEPEILQPPPCSDSRCATIIPRAADDLNGSWTRCGRGP
jgi:hypothetical protein